MRVSPATDFLMCKGGCAQFTRPEAHPPLFFRFRSLKQKPIGDFTTMTTSNHSYSRIYQLAPAGSRLAHYLDYLTTRPLLTPDIHFADLPDPASSPEHHDEDREQPQPRNGDHIAQDDFDGDGFRGWDDGSRPEDFGNDPYDDEVFGED